MGPIIVIVAGAIGILAVKYKAELEARRKAELETQRQAELEAQRKAELEAQQQTELEAQRKAELEARRKAELEAQQQAELEAQRKAELEAQRQREAEINKQREWISYDPQRNYLTREEETSLCKELKYLIEVQRPALTQKLKDAAGRESKVKKNADHHSTKEQQGHVERRIREIETNLHNAIIVEGPGSSREVQIGSTVIIREDGMNEDEEYEIVGVATAARHKISWKSPVGSALLGKKKGSKVKVQTPNGSAKFKVVDVR